MPHSRHPSGYFSPGFAAKQMRHAEEAVTDSPLLTPSGGLCAEQHWVTGSPRLPVHRTVYPGEQRPEVRPEESREALQMEVRLESERKRSLRDQVSVKDFAYDAKAVEEPSKKDLQKEVPKPDEVLPSQESGTANIPAGDALPRGQTPGSSPVGAEVGKDGDRARQPERKGHRRSPAKDLRMKHGVMTEV